MRRRSTSKLRTPRTLGQAALLLVVLLGLAVARQWQQETSEQSIAPPATETNSGTRSEGTARVERVVDGDTLVLVGLKEHVRLIGANTPETVKPNWPVEPWGSEASAFTKDFLAGGEVRLEFDGPRRDKYGRMLAFVWVGDRMLNEELIRAGLAKAELKYSYSAAMKDRFRQAEAEAKTARRGIWSE